MALKIIEGSVEEIGPATALPDDGGASWEFVRFSRGRKKPVTLCNVMADPKVGSRIHHGQMGKFAFYSHAGSSFCAGSQARTASRSSGWKMIRLQSRQPPSARPPSGKCCWAS